MPDEIETTSVSPSTATGVAWADASMTGVPDAFVAYLLPWD